MVHYEVVFFCEQPQIATHCKYPQIVSTAASTCSTSSSLD